MFNCCCCVILVTIFTTIYGKHLRGTSKALCPLKLISATYCIYLVRRCNLNNRHTRLVSDFIVMSIYIKQTGKSIVTKPRGSKTTQFVPNWSLIELIPFNPDYPALHIPSGSIKPCERCFLHFPDTALKMLLCCVS